MEKDPSESTNLASREPGKVKELSILIENWKKEVKAEEPDSEAINKVLQQPAFLAKQRTDDLSGELGLSNAQSKEMYEMFLDFFNINEKIRKIQMPVDEQKVAHENNNKKRHEKLIQIITPSQLEKLKEIWRIDTEKAKN